MATMQGQASVVAGAVSLNVLAGLLEELLKRPSAVRVFVNTDAVTTTMPTVKFMVGDRVIIDDQGVHVAASANRIAVPDDQVAIGAGEAGTRLTLKFSNLDSATRKFTWRVEVKAVA